MRLIARHLAWAKFQLTRTHGARCVVQRSQYSSLVESGNVNHAHNMSLSLCLLVNVHFILEDTF